MTRTLRSQLAQDQPLAHHHELRNIGVDAMACSQLTWRECSCDIKVCLNANREKVLNMGLENVPARSTLANALAQR